MCSLASYEFSFYKFPGKKLLFSVLMGAMMLPFILYVVPLYRFVYKLGLTDTYLGVAIPIMISPMSVFILNQFSETIPSSLIESARIDGAGHFQIYFKIYLPLVRNGLITVTVLMFLRSWGSYMWPALVTGNEVLPVSRTIANLLSANGDICHIPEACYRRHDHVQCKRLILQLIPGAVWSAPGMYVAKELWW